MTRERLATDKVSGSSSSTPPPMECRQRSLRRMHPQPCLRHSAPSLEVAPQRPLRRLRSQDDLTACWPLPRAARRPRAKGRLCEVTFGLACKIVQTTETFFTNRGEKWLRETCGGLMAKDESFGFLCTDLMHGGFAPRPDAIALGERLRHTGATGNRRGGCTKPRILF